MKLATLAMAFVAGATAEIDGLTPDIYFQPEHTVNITHKSGSLLAADIAHSDAKTYMLWDTSITPEAGATRTQLFFDRNTLLSDSDVDAVTLKIWSEQDGAVQLLNAHTIRHWDFKSAVFNGDSVHVQVLATPDAGLVNVGIVGALVGEGETDVGYQTLCGPSDNRRRSNSRQNFRYTTSGSCSGGLISLNGQDGCMMTAGHCGSGTAGNAAFNVPDSDSNGNTRQPGPEDQYAIDSSSVQFSNSGVGNDWKHIGAFPNSNTGRTAYATQGVAFPFPTNPGNPPSGNMMHNGHGSTSPRNNLNLVNKGTPNGGSWTRSTNTLRYRFDTTGGDSGSAVADSNGNYVGAHTHGGCTPSNPNSGNAGTWVGRPQLQAAVLNGRGICSNEGMLSAKAQRYGIHFRGDVHAFEGPRAVLE